ncbi:MAG: CBS domain-containing protein, partial [Oceanospirillum sp.]|nr:CBS domain-containing protein [Oceanospirillum sp.]
MESLKVSQMLSPQLITVSPEQDIAAVLQLMQQEKCSCVAVVAADQQPLGMFTEHHLIHQLARHQGPLKGSIAQFAAKPVAISEQTHRNDAFLTMAEHQLSHLLVVNSDNKLVGMVSNKDFTDHYLHLPITINLKVGQVMSRQVVTLPPQSNLQAALSAMDAAHISSIVVTENDQAVGILSERDLVQLALEHNDLSQIPLHEVM